MTNKIDKTYFWGENKIAGLSDATEINAYIAKYQPIYFKKMFGTETPAAELVALVVDSTLKLSPLANFVFYYWWKANINTTTTTGMASLNAQNTTDQSPAQNMVTQWNEMVNMNIDLHNQLLVDLTVSVAAITSAPNATPPVVGVAAYTITFLDDIVPLVDYSDSIFRKQNLIGI